MYVNPVTKMFTKLVFSFKTLTSGCLSIPSAEVALFLFPALCWHNQLNFTFSPAFHLQIGHKGE